MTADPKPTAAVATTPKREKGVRVFTYPKIIFIFPTFVTALICGIGMILIGDDTVDPRRAAKETNAKVERTIAEKGADASTVVTEKVAIPPRSERFATPQNLLGVLFLTVFAMNLLVMAIEFPRFTIVAGVFFFLFFIFLCLWISAFFEVNLMESVRHLLGTVYTVANAEFYFMFALTLGMMYGVIMLTRYLDYWEIFPNEILHHHGPLSDLERYPTTNLKFDKEIPDVIEHLFLGAGRIVLHLPTERKSIVLDNVLGINSIENKLKSLMSRMEVRLTTDQEAAEVS